MGSHVRNIVLAVAVLKHSSICFVDSKPPPNFIHDPLSVAAINESEVMFSCTANNTGIIDYVINGTKLDKIQSSSADIKMFFTNKNIEKSLEGTGITSNLTVDVHTQYNNTNISCEADDSDNTRSMDAMSKTAVLKVQGPLSPVVDLSYSFIDSSTVNISWSAPFTLPGTNITGYNVLATTSSETTNNFTLNSYYELMLTDITDSPCTEVNITVSGYNGLDGESSSVTVPTPVSGIQVQIDDISVDSDNKLITINLTNVYTCPDLVPSSLTLTLSNSSGITVNTANITVPDGSTNVTYDGFSIPDNMTYTLNVSYTVNRHTVTTITEIQGMDPVDQSPTSSTDAPSINSSHSYSTSTSSTNTDTSTKTTTTTSPVSSSSSNIPTMKVTMMGLVMAIVLLVLQLHLQSS